jgi:tetratricopeptide (TPR) repeat protein
MVTVVGDPLYRPFGHNPEDQLQKGVAGNSPWLEWGYLRLVDLNLANGRPPASALDFLEQLELTRHSSILSEKLAELCASLGKPSSAVHAYQQALTLHPSPEQRLRIRLALGDRLDGLGLQEEAYENYQKLLEEMPDYPDKPVIYRRLLALARNLNKKTDAERYEALGATGTASNAK